VPGRPGLYATTKQFLDYFNITTLNQLPTLQEIIDLDKTIDNNQQHSQAASEEQETAEELTETTE